MAPTGGGQNATSGPQEKSAWQVAASNSTVNTWFGGRQPSWMATAKPAKPTPRPPQLPKQQPLPQQPTQTTTPPISAATVHQQQKQKHQQPQQQPQPVLHQQQLQQPNPSIPTPSAQSRQQFQPAQTSTGNLAPEAVLPSPAPSDEPSPSISNSHESPSVANSLLPVSPAEAQFTDRRYFVVDVQPDAPRPTEQRQVQPPTGTTTANAQPVSRQSDKVSVTSAERPLAVTTTTATTTTATTTMLTTPPTPSVSGFRGSTQQARPQMAKRRRVETYPSRELLQRLRAFEILQNHILMCKTGMGSESNIQQARLQLLRDACEQGDLVFIVLHQIFCRWSVAANEIRQICSEAGYDISLIEAAFGTMGTLLRHNSTLQPEALQWLSNYPAPLAELRREAVYTDALRLALDFLLRLSFHWMITTYEHQTSGYPLLMDEMVKKFALYSPVLQVIIFRASWRNLGMKDDRAGQQMEAMFREDQRLYHNDGSNGGSCSSRSPAYRASLVTKYQTLVMEARARDMQGFRQNTSSHPSPVSLQNSPRLPNQVYQESNTGPVPMQVTTPSTVAGAFTESPVMSPIPSNVHIGNYQIPLAPVPSRSNSLLSAFLYTASQPPNTSQQPQFNFNAANIQGQQQQYHHQQQHHPQTQVIQHQSLQQGQQIYQAVPDQQLQHQLNTLQPWQTRLTGRRSSQPRVGYRQHLFPMPPGSILQMPAADQHTVDNTPPTPFGANIQQSQQAVSTAARTRPGVVHPAVRHTVSASERLIPSPNTRIGMQDYPHDPYQRSCLHNTLHQAHLRSPRRVLRRDIPPNIAERHYQSVKNFLLEPAPVPPHRHLYKFNFQIQSMLYARVCRNEMGPGDASPFSQFSNGSLLIRLRCCYLKKATTPILDTDWVPVDTTWPEHIFIEVNGNPVGIRRKAHYSKDLPIDISSSVVSGDNSVNVYIPLGNNVHPYRHPVIAVELLEILSHSAVMHMVEKMTVPSDETRDMIKRRLAGPSADDDDDDELAMVDTDLSIDLADPFTFSIFKIPVRGKACTHLECFDLETWLNTRLSRKTVCQCGVGDGCKSCREPSFPDKWKCPLCDGDARPYSLRIDGFLAEVREKLHQDGQLRTKSILVSADGSWRPKEQAGDENDSDSDGDGDGSAPVKRARSVRSSTRPSQPPCEVVEISD